MAERYRAALDMAEWADRAGFYTIVLSEHHGSADGYLPGALAMAAAMAARTSRIRIRVAAVVAAFHDPLRLAEDAAVVDNLSGGRLDLVVGAGYVPAEFAMFGVEPKERVRRTVETVTTLRNAWTGEPFEYRGRTVRVTPAPCSPGGPPLDLGGSSEAAARRAARLGVGFMATDPGVWEFYRDETIRLGRPDPGPYLGGNTGFVHLAEDVEEGWEQIAPYALHESASYGGWLAAGGPGSAEVYRPIGSVAELRASGQYRVLRPAELVAELTERGPLAVGLLHPMMGGIPPEIAWRSLRLLETEVLPRLDA
ncbi:LLM class flavin-dependent oxidoreductase [Actinomadura craniellae]|uniref:LLM class flavin-dependent oxidoreductase n=2 Tax=Actinomadura craniellae TaxID=2231787 RepID=A0A365GW42_9ACTN|nr:LLM class flavin-dependent oxidoreductase [Actinomadura craniellae]